ncbi:MAG TPA: DICT sensory domain-containing protein [Solirubrobacteraceae bacterium]|nr:DICT sensory domain-containing protein [Solirubrobacteraceae bacterium]
MYRFPIERVANSELTTAQLAERTGLSAGTLRMWESRHGFPDPSRLPGGHRRYSEADAEQVREVLRLRDQGLSLPAAIQRARSRRAPLAVSVFAGLRRRRPDVAPTVLPKPAVLALSRAIEDEYCAQAADGVLIGSFQRERFYRRAQHRWRELARTADLAVALADFARRADPADGPVEVPIGPRHALSREWAVIINAEGVRACLAAWEQPGEADVPDAQRRFEVLWSFEPSVVSDAMTVAAELLSPIDSDLAGRVRSALQDAAGDVDPGPALRYGGAVAHRMVGYLGGMLITP